MRTDPELVVEVDRRVGLLSEIFDLALLRDSGTTATGVRKYYEDSRLGYWAVHSREGAMHMALNPDGDFDRAGYEGQARLVEARLPAATTDVLELACGNGYNLALLAARHPKTRFLGLDLVQTQVDRANGALVHNDNARAMVGDFQAITLPADAYDGVFVIESLCHATDLSKAFGEVRRVLRPGGRFVVIDAWRSDSFAAFPQPVRQAAAYVERGMAVSAAQELSAWKRIAGRAGLRVIEDLELTDQVRPNLDRLARIAETRLLNHPLRARILKKVLPDTLLLNAVSGYLMPLTVESGIHTYRLVMLEAV